MGSLATEEMPGVQPVEDAKNQRLTPPAARCQIGHRWRELQGAQNWKGLLKPQLDEDLRAEIVRYGELTEVTYDAFDFDKHSVYCGSCKWSKENLFKEAELLATGYTVTRYPRNIHLRVSLVYSRARVESLKERAFSLARGLLRVIVHANPLTLNLKSWIFTGLTTRRWSLDRSCHLEWLGQVDKLSVLFDKLSVEIVNYHHEVA